MSPLIPETANHGTILHDSILEIAYWLAKAVASFPGTVNSTSRALRRI
jgi:hypothetical protein